MIKSIVTAIPILAALAACKGDQPRVAVITSSQQPTSPTDGLLADVYTYCSDSECWLQVTTIGGQIQRPADSSPVNLFCQKSEADLPVILFLASGRTEAIVQAQLLKGGKDKNGHDITSCTGDLLAATQAVLPTPTMHVDAGTLDASGVDGGAKDASTVDGGSTDANPADGGIADAN